MEERTKAAEDNFNLKKIADMIKDIRYGSLTIIVQDGKIIQIDKTEKVRIKNGLENQRFCWIYRQTLWFFAYGRTAEIVAYATCARRGE